MMHKALKQQRIHYYNVEFQEVPVLYPTNQHNYIFTQRKHKRNNIECVDILLSKYTE